MAKPATSLKAFRAKSVLTKRQQDDSRHRMMTRVSKMVNRIADCADGKLEMTSAQLKAAEMLLNRTVPVLSAIPMINDDDTEDLSREEIEARIKQKIEDSPMLGILAGLTPNTIDGTVVTKESESVDGSAQKPEGDE